MIFDCGTMWLRADFHLHTRADKGRFRYEGEENSYITEYIHQMIKEKINLGVITNHNKFDKDEYKALAKAGKKFGIYLLPGVELSVDDGANGIHTLIVFDPEDWLKDGVDHINAFIASIFAGKANYGSPSIRTKYNLIDTIKHLDEFAKDYFIIMAHVEQNNGFFKELEGGRIIELSNHELFRTNVLGFQKLRTRELYDKLKMWFKGRIPALVEGSDPSCVEEIGKGEKIYIKIGDFNFKAVKYALSDYEGRISKTLPPLNKAYIQSVSFVGGKLDGESICFSPEMNNLIGIRGSGKSTIIEIIRYCLDIPLTETSQDIQYKNRIIANGLGSGGKVVINAVDKYGNSYSIERVYGHSVKIYDEDHNLKNISVDSIIQNPLYFGQKDLSSPREGFETDLMDKLMGKTRTGILQKIEGKKTEVISNIQQWMNLRNSAELKKEFEAQKADLQHKLKVYKERGVEEKLKRQVAFERDDLKLSEILKNLSAFKDACYRFYEENKAKLDEIAAKYESAENQNTFDRIFRYLNELISELELLQKTGSKTEEYIKKIKAEIADFKNKKNSLEEEFAKIQREINIPNLNADEFVKINRSLNILEVKLAEVNKNLTKREELFETIKRNLAELNDLWLEEYKLYEAEIKKINDAQKSLKIEIKFKEERGRFREHLKEVFRGSGLRENHYTFIVENFIDYIEVFFDIIKREGSKIKGYITDTTYANFVTKFTEYICDLLTYKVPNKIEILYHGKPLMNHSLGQRASALILFILAQKDNDLVIIDQPEDDLDNQTIYEEVIKVIKEVKPEVQFIFATHNANIPVLGDAEKVIACEYGEKISVFGGSIDMWEIQSKIISIMEGGKDAFRRRREIYNLWKY